MNVEDNSCYIFTNTK